MQDTNIETKDQASSKMPHKRRNKKSEIVESKSETVSELKSATTTSLSVQEALELPVPTIEDGLALAKQYIAQVDDLIERTECDLTELVARIGTVLLAYRKSEHGSYGKWEAFINANFSFSVRTARNYMSLALETTPEQRAGKGLTEVYEEIGVVTRPGEVAKTRFLATLEKVEKQASAAIEGVHKVAEAFENAVSPYNGSNRDIGTMIHEYANHIATQMKQCQEAATLVSNSVQTIAGTTSPEGAAFHAEGLEAVRQRADWSEYPEGTTIDEKQPEEMTCCDREAVMAFINKSTGACRECGRKVTK